MNSDENIDHLLLTIIIKRAKVNDTIFFFVFLSKLFLFFSSISAKMGFHFLASFYSVFTFHTLAQLPGSSLTPPSLLLTLSPLPFPTPRVYLPFIRTWRYWSFVYILISEGWKKKKLDTECSKTIPRSNKMFWCTADRGITLEQPAIEIKLMITKPTLPTGGDYYHIQHIITGQRGTAGLHLT